MELDFTKMDSLTPPGAEGEIKGAAEGFFRPSEALEAASDSKAMPRATTALKELSGAKTAPGWADQKGGELERAREVYRIYQENIKRAQTLQQEISKGVTLAEDVYTLFLKAAEAISLMTSNMVFYNHVEAGLREIYGAALRETGALQMALKQAQERLERLREAEAKETEKTALNGIQRAIKANEERIRRLSGE